MSWIFRSAKVWTSLLARITKCVTVVAGVVEAAAAVDLARIPEVMVGIDSTVTIISIIMLPGNNKSLILMMKDLQDTIIMMAVAGAEVEAVEVAVATIRAGHPVTMLLQGTASNRWTPTGIT